jgi:preprotein translocase subunit SecG
MQLLTNIVLIVQILSAVVMIGLVLIQHGKGADMGASFGSGASGSLFGATGSANFLSRSTAVCAAVFFVCTLALAFVSAAASKVRGGGDTVPRQASPPRRVPQPERRSGAVIPGAVIPGAASAAIPAATTAPPASATR